VLANSKLSVGGSAAGMVAGGAGAALLALFDSAWVLRIDIVVYLACAWADKAARLDQGGGAVPSAHWTGGRTDGGYNTGAPGRAPTRGLPPAVSSSPP